MTAHCSYSRDDLKQLPAICSNDPLKLGPYLRVGTDATPSKTEAIYFPLPRRLYSDADTSRLEIVSHGGVLFVLSIFTTELECLGSIVNQTILQPQKQTLRSALDQHRPPFGLLKTFLPTRTLISKFNQQGCETWCCPGGLFNRLRHFHY
jgi:hypothetical protein